MLQGTWDLPHPGIEPTSLALAGEFFTTGPLGTSEASFLLGLPIKHPTGPLGARRGVGSAEVHQQAWVPLVGGDGP